MRFLHTAYLPLYTCQEQVLKLSLLRFLTISNEFTCAMEQGRCVFGANVPSPLSFPPSPPHTPQSRTDKQLIKRTTKINRRQTKQSSPMPRHTFKYKLKRHQETTEKERGRKKRKNKQEKNKQDKDPQDKTDNSSGASQMTFPQHMGAL